jgi:hypothetical protein
MLYKVTAKKDESSIKLEKGMYVEVAIPDRSPFSNPQYKQQIATAFVEKWKIMIPTSYISDSYFILQQFS